MSVCLYVCMSVCLYVCLYVRMYTAATTLLEGAQDGATTHTPAGDLLAFHHREPADPRCTSVMWRLDCTEADRKRVQRVTNTAQNVTGCPLPSITTIYNAHCLSRARNISKDNTHPGFCLLLPSSRRFRSIPARTNRLRDSFFHKAVTVLNSNLH